MKEVSTIYTTCAEQTEQCGASLAEYLLKDATLPRFVALFGDLVDLVDENNTLFRFFDVIVRSCKKL